MIFSNTKNFIITFFVILAIYQTTELWFEDFSSHSPFFITSENTENKNIKSNYNLENIIINTGNNKLINIQNDINSNYYNKTFDSAISTTISKGSYLGETTIDFDKLLNNKLVIYNYSYFNDIDFLTKTLYITKKISSSINKFDKIFIIPNYNFSEKMQVILFNSNTSKGYSFELKKGTIIADTYNYINELSSIEKNIFYTSSVKSGFELFSKNVLIPSSNTGTLEYPLLSIKNPLENEGGILLNNIERYINIFFENPATKWSSNINNIYTYSDETTVVKYHTSGVLEYTNYQAKNNINNDNFKKNYDIAINFLLTDTNIKNEFYLKDYEILEDKTIFYFDYKINDFPVFLNSDKKSSTGMNSMIELTISNGYVSKYKKLVYELVSSTTNIVSLDFLDIINQIYSNNDLEKDISKLVLGYKLKDKNELAKLNWILEIQGKEYCITMAK